MSTREKNRMSAMAVSRRHFLAGTAAAALTAAMAGVMVDGFTSAALAATKRGGILKAAFSADPAGFDPVRGPSGMSHVVIEQVYSTLMAA